MSQFGETRGHVLFLFSDTGGGHRSASEAISEALEVEYGGQVTTEMVDIFKQYAPPPLEYAPTIYPYMARVPDLWNLGYRLSNGTRRTRAFTLLTRPYVSRSIHRLVTDHPSDLIVSIHQCSNGTFLRALGDRRPPFITVVTDMVSTHALWYHPRADQILVPTQEARQRGIDAGVSPEKIRVVGMPVALKFTRLYGDKQDLRRKLNWPTDKPVVLLVGGGEGMGPIEAMAKAIDEAGLDLFLAVIAGRNHGLRTHLEEHTWQIPHQIFGFVKEIPEMMSAADVLVTKAGPGTISEGFIAGLPIILYSKMPGQEDGNVDYVVDHGAGVWAPQPERVVSVLRSWIENPEKRALVAANSKSLAMPDATRKIAQTIGMYLRQNTSILVR